MGHEAWHLGDMGLTEIDLEFVGITFDQLGIFFLDLFFEIAQAMVELVHVVLDARDTAMKLIHHFVALELGFLLCLCRQGRLGSCGGFGGWTFGGGAHGSRGRGVGDRGCLCTEIDCGE